MLVEELVLEFQQLDIVMNSLYNFIIKEIENE